MLLNFRKIGDRLTATIRLRSAVHAGAEACYRMNPAVSTFQICCHLGSWKQRYHLRNKLRSYAESKNYRPQSNQAQLHRLS